MAEYIDYAEYYDADTDYTLDIPFYLEYAQKAGSPALELACGTGRVLIPIAEAGFEIYGIDLSENMLNICRQKIEEKELNSIVHLEQANMASFDLPRKDFGFAYIPVRSFMHLFTQEDQLACLRHVNNHLRHGAYFIIDIYAPNIELLAQKPNGPFIIRKEYDLSNGNHVIRKDRFVKNDIINQIQHCEILFEEFDSTRTMVKKRKVPMATRYTFRWELQLLLEATGFDLVDIYRDYDKSPYDGTGELIAVACRL